MPNAILLVGAIMTVLLATASDAALLARWSFDEAEDETVAVDSAGSIDGTLEGDAVFEPGAGIRGGAVSIDSATDDRVNMGNKYSFAGNAAFSLQVWVKTTSKAGMVVVGRHTMGSLNGYMIALNDVGDGAPNEVAGSCHFYQSDNPQHHSGDVGLDDGEWHQILVVRDAAAGHHRLYVDGRRVPGEGQTGGLTNISASASPLLVGGVTSAGELAGSYTGLVDEVRIWNNALDDAEALYLWGRPDAIDAGRCGDANDDDAISAADALLALRTAVHTASCSACSCDTNSSTVVTAADALQILRRSVAPKIELRCPDCF
jgi:hypothetical protein